MYLSLSLSSRCVGGLWGSWAFRRNGTGTIGTLRGHRGPKNTAKGRILFSVNFWIQIRNACPQRWWRVEQHTTTVASVLEIAWWPSRTFPLETSIWITAPMRRAFRCVLSNFLCDKTFAFWILSSLLKFHLRPWKRAKKKFTSSSQRYIHSCERTQVEAVQTNSTADSFTSPFLNFWQSFILYLTFVRLPLVQIFQRRKKPENFLRRWIINTRSRSAPRPPSPKWTLTSPSTRCLALSRRKN